MLTELGEHGDPADVVEGVGEVQLQSPTTARGGGGHQTGNGMDDCFASPSNSNSQLERSEVGES